ncbi:AMP-binding protein [Halomonas sp. M4R5S39]|uniref:AMP-binding protein n=1 Tax=Halomonas kalidii TaxID=3043293 RepID=UPI0024A96F50|nr:AMP-binding protein [Halomonas kalidii]MDI5986160.1 AMP-binding protein [Halomonas kalidii]
MARSNDNRPPKEAEALQRRLLEVIDALVRETRPRQGGTRRPTLETRLDRDLGLDSMARSELLLRLEDAFAVTLPENVLMADTPAELLEILLATPGTGRETSSVAPAADSAPVEGAPDTAESLNAVLDWHLARHPDRAHLHIYAGDDTPQTLSYADLERGARGIAVALRRRGLPAGSRVALMLPTEPDYFIAFFGILRAGAVPVPIYPPARSAQLEEHLRRHGRILTNAGVEILITVPEARRVARLLRAEAPRLAAIVTVADLDASTAAGITDAEPPAATSLALLQYTSGSTGDPKGVTLTHGQLLANIRAMGERLEVTSRDVFVSWLPLYHDMGLIGAWLGSLYHAIPLVVMSPLAFLARPLRWLELIHHHRATLSGGPNFGYELCLRSLTPERLQGLDLSSWRVAFNGAEPVSARTMQRFAEALAPCGLRPGALMPVYGLAEAAVGLCISPPGRGLVLDRAEREAFTARQQARPARGKEPALTFVNCGPPLPGYAIRAVARDGRELPERHEGDIEFRGPSATAGYFDTPAATRDLFDGEWLRTGDRGYLADGDLYISGRVKDVLVRGGRNLYPYDLEEAIGRVEGVRKGCVAVFGDPDPESGVEELVVVAETQVDDSSRRDAITQAIRDVTVDIVNVPADAIRLVPPHSVLKTSSGKLRRAATAELYRSGRLGQGGAPVWRQALGLAAKAGMQRARLRLARLGERLYAAYAWSVCGLGAAMLGMLALPLPRLAWRWRVAHHVARLAAVLAGLSIERHGVDRLPRRAPCVLVANHASYLDALVLTAALPRGFRYLAKAELRRRWLSRLVLKRMGVLFVERFDPRQATRDTQRIFAAVEGDDSLAFFPEGTFHSQVGVGDFHMGAFVISVQSGVPVLPVALQGTRDALRGREWLPHPGRVRVSVGEAIQPTTTGWAEAVRLRDAARSFILAECGEPDRGTH